MADKYWWEEDEEKEKQDKQPESQGYWWDDGNLANEVGTNISNRVNTWLKNHNNYVSNYQNRYKDRKYTYDDAYVKDSASWVDTISKQKSNFDAEAESILSYMDQFSSVLDAEWVKSVRDTLSGASNQQSAILDNSSKDHEWWSNFKDESEYQTAGRYDGYNKKYTGQKYDAIQEALATLEDGEEKDWLSYYQHDLYSQDGEYTSKALSGLKSFEAQKVAEKEKEDNKNWFEKVLESYATTGDSTAPAGNLTTVVSAYQNDTSYKEPNDNWSEAEKTQFGYLYATDKEKAETYAIQLNSYYNAEAERVQQQNIGAAASKNFGSGVLNTIGAVATAPFGLADYMDDLAQAVGRGVIMQDGNITPFEYSQAAQSGVSSKLNAVDENGKAQNVLPEWVPVLGGKGWGDIYGLGVSTANSMVSALTLGGTGTLVNFIGQGGAAGVDDALNRGATADQAILYGTIVGSLEGLMEMIPAEKLVKVGSSATLKNYLKQMAKQGVGEFFEEGATTFFGNLADEWVMKDKSNFNIMVQELMEEDPNLTKEEAEKIALGRMINDLAFDAVGGFASGATNAMVVGGTHNIIDSRKGSKANKEAVKQYGEFTGDLIQEGLQSDPKSESYQLAKQYQKQTEGKNGKEGKALSGFQIRNLVSANDSQFAVEEATARLTELGETKDVDKLAQLVAKRATGQELSRLEKRTLANSQYGAKVAKDMLDSAKENEITYKPLTERVGEESRYNVSESGQTTLRNENEAIKITEVSKIEDGQLYVKLEDGREEYAGDIDFANDSESVLYSAIADMENITPAAATALIKNFDPASEKSVGEYVNGVDEAYTYGYYGYSVEDLKVGDHAVHLSNEQMMSAYKLGQSARAISNETHDAPLVQMRTAKQAAISKKQASQQLKAQFASNDSEVYFMDGANVTKFDEAGHKYDEKRMAGVNAAKFLSKLGIGKKYYFYESYVNAEGVRVYKDSNGVEKKAPNGMYNTSDGSIYIDLNAGNNGEGTTLFTMGHELTHFVKDHSEKQFKNLSDLVTEAFRDTDMDMNQRVLKKQKELSDARGEKISYSEAFEEVVADSMSTMLTDGNLYEKLTQLKTKDKGLFNTIKKFFENLIAKFKELYASLTPDQKDAQDVRQMKEMFDKIQTAFAEALVEASENPQALAQAGIEVNDETDSGSLQSVRYVLNEADRKKAAKALAERFDVTVEEAKNWLKAETSLASIILNPKYSQFLDYEADPNEVAIKQNSDYPQGTVDFSNICKKRREFTQVMNRILRNFPNHVFAATDLAKIRTIMGEEGMTLPCGICYVEDRRQLDTIVAQDFINGLKLYRDGSKTRPDGKPFNANQLKGLQLTDGDTYVPTIYELVTLEGRNSLKEKNPNMEAAWVKYNNARGMQAVRLLTNEAEYKRQILKYNKNTVQSKNDHGGLRIYSFSDMEMFHLIDIIQVLTDCATVGLKVQGYTKVNEYAKAVKDTGEKLNRSLIPKGDLGYNIENGKVVLDYDTVEGIDIHSEDFFDSKDNPDVGNITIGINSVQIRAAMVSDFVDYIIPFHTGQSEEVLGEKGIAAWENYKDYQTEKDLTTGKTSEHQVNIYTEVFQAAEKEGNPIQNKRQFVEKFLQVCKENNLQPRFSQFLNVDSDGNYVYTEGYHKFLVDFKTFAQTEVGEYLPQRPVKPIFDDAYITSLLEAYVEEQQVKDAEVAKQMPKVIKRITNEIVKPASDIGTMKSDRTVTSWDIAWDSDNNSSLKSQLIAHMEEVNAMSPVTEVVFDKSKGKTYAAILDDILRTKFGYKIARQDGVTFLFDEVAIGTLRHYVTSDEEAAAVISAPYVLKRGKAISGHKNHKNRGYPSVTYAAPVTINGDKVNVAVSVLFADKDRPHSLRVLMPSGEEYVMQKIKTDPGMEEATPKSGVPSPTGSVSNKKVSQPKQKVNKNSDRDSTGNHLSQEQQEYFADSKVRDKDGNLLVMYHGSSSDTKFTVFERRPMVNGRVHGEGYYFTEDKNEAYNWGSSNIYKVYVDLRNPYYVSKDGEVPAAIVVAAKENYGKSYDKLSQDPNWWGSKLTREEYIEKNSRMWSNPDIALSSAIDSSYRLDASESEYYEVIGQRTTELLKSLGYDGVIVATSRAKRNFQEVVAFDSEQIKLTINKKPTKNPDIRYSDRQYKDAVDRGDMETAQRMVDEAAKEAGYSVKVYHGTNQMGFTVFDPKKSDDKISLFFTDSQTVAKTYASHHAKVKPTSSFPEIKSFKYERGKKYSEEEMREAFDLIQSVSYIYGIPKFNVENQTMYHAGTRYSAKQLMELADNYSRMGLYEVFVNPDGMMEVDAENHNWNSIADPDVVEYRYKINYKGENFNYFKAKADDAFTLSLYKDGKVEYNGDITFSEMMRMLRDRLGASRAEMAVRHATDGSGMGSLYHDHAYSDANGNYAKKFLTTRELAKRAKNEGYKGLIIKNVYDNGGKATGSGWKKYDVPSNLYIMFDSNQVKSADPVTYDADGKVIPLSERFKTGNDDIRYSERNNAPIFYSQMGKVVEGMKQEKFGASSVISMLRGRGVKAEEIRWSGIQAFLDGKKSVTKAELLEFIKGSMLQIEEEHRGGTAFNEFMDEWRAVMDYDAGVENVVVDDAFMVETEAYLQDAVDEGNIEQEEMDHLMDLARKAKDSGRPTKWDTYKLDGGENYRELVFKMPGSDYTNRAMRGHWGNDAQGVLAHARMQDFDTEGGKMLFIEEIQSDWHNEGHRSGYGEPLSDTERKYTKNALLKKFVATEAGKDIVNKTMRYWALSEAEAHEKIADDPADVGAELLAMYPFWMNEERLEAINKLDEQVSNLYRKRAADAPFKDNYHEFVLKRLLRMAAEEGYDSIGWTTADIQSERWSDEYAEGYRIEYDQDIPKFLKKYGKQWGAEVGKTNIGAYSYDIPAETEAPADMDDDMWLLREDMHIEEPGTEVWSMDITEAMKKSVLEEGQVLYSERTEDSVSNRSLLANAFEGIVQNSVEYKMLQDYKGRIKELNELETKLSQLNAEIRKIRFGTEGARDTKKLTELENEAKETAKEINRYDKRLLNLEASEPLRKVIDRERKKEAQKTKEHVKEIQQNKKVRAEQTELRHKIRKVVRDLDKILNRGNKKLNVKEDMQNVVTKALKAADILFTDNYGNYDILRNGIGTDLSDSEEALVATCTKMLKDIDKMPSDGHESWLARQEAEERLRIKMSKLKDVFARERKRLNNTTVSSILGELADAYASLEKSEQSYVQGAYTEAVHNFLKNLQSEVGGTIVKDMTKSQLESVYAAYQMVLNTVRNANKMFNEALKQSREELGNAVIQEVINAGGTHGLWTKGEIARSQASWNNMKPVWVASRIGSDTFGKLMNGLFNGQYNFAVDVDEAKQFKLEMDNKYHPRNWDAEKLHSFESSTGKKFSLNLQQIMSLYAFSKREQAYSHLLNGGFVYEANSTVVVDQKGIKRTYLHDGATSYKLSEASLNEIINTLSAEQKAYVDEMQKYLSDIMGAKGNEVSMKLYGIQLFKEKFYFPLRSSGAYMEKAKEAEMKKQQGQINIVNSGFTHAVKPEAKNPIILAGFMDVWAEHCNEMSMYHSMVLPMEDFRKVYNYSTVHDEKLDSASVYQTIQDAYGNAATSYLDQLYRELNAGATIDPRETAFKARISKFKKAAVMLSASVVVQQFSSIGRAYAVIDPKYFIGTKVNSGTQMSVAEEMKKYAPVAIIKEMGGFDTGTKGSAKNFIMAEQYGKGERIKGLAKDEQYRGDIMSYLPAKADEITWCTIWEAVKRETKAKHSNMDVKSEAFLKLAGERFSEIIEKTQVYDSVLARSANMRSKSGLMQMATAFMAEPTTTINLIEDALRGRSVKNIARAFGAVAASIVLNNALASLIYAMRDDDDDETLIEKYFQSFASGMVDDINPMTYYPFLKDIYSLFQGYDVERADMSVIADLRDAAKKAVNLIGKDTSDMDEAELAEHYKNVNEVMMSLLDAGCSAFGVPVKNVRRDVNGIINAYKTIKKDIIERDTTWNSFWDKVGSAVKDTIPIYAWTKDKAKADKLYDAIISGDKEYLGRIKATYKTDDAYASAVRKVLRENDPRIHEAAQAKYSSNLDEYKRIFREIQSDGKFSFNEIMESINSELSEIKKETEPSKVTAEYSSTDFVNAVLLGETQSADAMREDIISSKIANGKTMEEAEESFADSVKDATRKAFDSGLIDEAGVAEILTTYTDMDDEEADAKINYWAFCKAHPRYDLSESNVNKYWEFAEPADISLDVFTQYVNGTKGLETIRDEWDDEVKSKREQVLEVIDSLDLTWQQKDALYLAYGYSESTILDVPW